MTRGAAVVSRTGEATLSTSAVRAIDTNATTIWVSPPANLKQSFVFSLPSRSRVEQVGLSTSAKRETAIRSAKFELSEDGEHFTDVGTYAIKMSAEAQLFRISPRTARYVRLTTLAGNAEYVQLGTAYAIGEGVEPQRDPSIDGTWSINEQPASFIQKGSHVDGRVEGNLDFFLEGGSDGRFFRFAWTRAKDLEYGLAAISVSLDGKHLSGMVWHEEALQAAQFWADDWLGDRSGAPASAGGAPASAGGASRTDRPAEAGAPLRSYLERFGYFPLYGLRFDDAGHLSEQQSVATIDAIIPYIHPNKTRFVAHELNRNPAIGQTEMDTLRAALQKRGVDLTNVDFVPMGNREPRRPTFDDLTRAMYSSVEIQIRR
jgi:hypothetical protein